MFHVKRAVRRPAPMFHVKQAIRSRGFAGACGHEQRGERRRRHAGNARGLVERLGPDGSQALRHFIRKASNRAIIELGGNGDPRVVLHDFPFALLTRDIGLVKRVRLSLLGIGPGVARAKG